jgi:Fur family transcriptional regulator, peroxide stress response regulator
MLAQVEFALEKLKSTGVRMTPQRHAILSYLIQTKSHPTADDIYRSLESRFPSMSVATVYNNLKVFVESGLVREMKFGDASSRYDADMHDHYHAICVSCGKIADFEHTPIEGVEEAATEKTGFLIQGHRLEVHGLCPECGHTMTH